MSERPKGWVVPVCVLSVLIGLPWRIVHLGQRWAGGGINRHSRCKNSTDTTSVGNLNS